MSPPYQKSFRTCSCSEIYRNYPRNNVKQHIFSWSRSVYANFLKANNVKSSFMHLCYLEHLKCRLLHAYPDRRTFENIELGCVAHSSVVKILIPFYVWSFYSSCKCSLKQPVTWFKTMWKEIHAEDGQNARDEDELKIKTGERDLKITCLLASYVFM